MSTTNMRLSLQVWLKPALPCVDNSFLGWGIMDTDAVTDLNTGDGLLVFELESKKAIAISLDLISGWQTIPLPAR